MNIAPSQADKKCALQVAEVLAQAGHPVIPASLLHACAPASVKSPRQAREPTIASGRNMSPAVGLAEMINFRLFR